MTADDIITLENARQRLQVAPGMGGSLTRWDRNTPSGWSALFRPWDGASVDRYTLSCFPLVPWSNRITNGGFEHEGRFHPVQNNRAEEPYPIHGDGWLQAWSVLDQGSDRIRLGLESREYDGNPYHYRSTQTFLLMEDGLQIDLTVTHLGQGTLPYGLGLHPYFTCNAETLFSFKSEGVWLCGDDPIPTSHTNIFPDTWNYNSPSKLAGPLIDNCFTGWNGKAIVAYPDQDFAITMVMPDCNGYCLFYRPPGDNYFCFEPITHPIDAFNMPEKPGLAFLGHGDSLALRAKFLIGALPQT